MRYLKTLQGKVAAALAVAVLLSFAVQIAVQAVLQRSSLTETMRHEVAIKTQMLATAARAGFLAGDVFSIESEFKPLSEREDTTLSGVAAFDKDGQVLLDYRSKTLPAPDMTTVWTQHADALAAFETVSFTVGNTVVVAVPVTNRKATRLNGVLAVAWSLHRQNTAVVNATLWGSAVSIAGMIVLVGVLAWLVGRMISRPLARVTGALTRVANGDLDVAVGESDRDDEIGAIARTVAVFRDNAGNVQRLTEAQSRAADERRRDMLALADSLENSVKLVTTALGAASSGMQESAQSMTRAADDTSSRSSAVAHTADATSANVQTVASAIEELSSSVTDIRRQVEQSTTIANRAVEEAKQTNETMRGLSEAAEKVGAIVQLITGIAEQTNLLALNATIEAARAGEAGKGFAVVASEVKSLATQTAKATEDIAQQVSGIQSVTSEAVAAITHIGQVIGEISRIAATIAESVDQQGQATQEIARNTTEVVAGVHEVSETIGEVNRAADTARQAAGQVTEAADRIAEQSDALDREVERFLAQVRA